jgi:hypothetical protein
VLLLCVAAVRRSCSVARLFLAVMLLLLLLLLR